jgi:hypothetical protein
MLRNNVPHSGADGPLSLSFLRCPTSLPACPASAAVLGDMCQAGLLNVYALAEPLVQQNSDKFTTTIQVGGRQGRPCVWVGWAWAAWVVWAAKAVLSC